MTSIRQVRRVGRRSGLWLALGAAWPLLLVSPTATQAQGFGPDPFRPFNSQYDSSVYPVAPGPLAPYGNAGLNLGGVRSANQFENYLEGVGSGRGAGMRYDQANRAYDRQFGREYQPNRKADAKFEDQQGEITDIYFRYLRERNPKKRAALLKEYNQARNRSTRDLSSSRATNARTSRKAQRDLDDGAAADGSSEPSEKRSGELERDTMPPAPPIRGGGRSVSGRRASPRPSDVPAPPTIPGSTVPRSGGRSPSQILERALESEGSSAPARPRSNSAEPAIPPAPAPVP